MKPIGEWAVLGSNQRPPACRRGGGGRGAVGSVERPPVDVSDRLLTEHQVASPVPHPQPIRRRLMVEPVFYAGSKQSLRSSNKKILTCLGHGGTGGSVRP